MPTRSDRTFVSASIPFSRRRLCEDDGPQAKLGNDGADDGLGVQVMVGAKTAGCDRAVPVLAVDSAGGENRENNGVLRHGLQGGRGRGRARHESNGRQAAIIQPYERPTVHSLGVEADSQNHESAPLHARKRSMNQRRELTRFCPCDLVPLAGRLKPNYAISAWRPIS